MRRISLMTLFVEDYDTTIAFYTQKLGFAVAEDVPFGDQRWVTLRFPDDDVMSVALHRADGKDEKGLVGKQGGSAPLFGIVTGDCLGDYAKMKAAGVRFESEPVVQPYGTGVTLEDLYGNKIYLNEEPK
jgi:catechol 2,3-dioxygenase-like lactoylglutathione lyase family enzyme